MDCSKLVGMDKYSALDFTRKQGYTPRIVKENGKMFSFYEEAQNVVLLTIRDGIVTRAEVEY